MSHTRLKPAIVLQYFGIQDQKVPISIIIDRSDFQLFVKKNYCVINNSTSEYVQNEINEQPEY